MLEVSGHSFVWRRQQIREKITEKVHEKKLIILLSSLLLLRIKYLRLCLDNQENPELIKYSKVNFQNILNHTLFIYGNFSNRSIAISKKIK